MNMANSRITPELEAELSRLALLSDEDIDTSDIPEALSWTDAKRGMFAERELLSRGYDVRAIANWFLDRASAARVRLTNMALNKLVYLAIERSLVERLTLLTPARIEAWDHGPVFREVYHSFAQFANQPITSRAGRFSPTARAMVQATEEFYPEDILFFEEMMRRYGDKSAGKLREISHVVGGPWDTVWRYRGRSNPGMEITVPIIFQHAPDWREVNEKKRRNH